MLPRWPGGSGTHRCFRKKYCFNMVQLICIDYIVIVIEKAITFKPCIRIKVHFHFWNTRVEFFKIRPHMHMFRWKKIRSSFCKQLWCTLRQFCARKKNLIQNSGRQLWYALRQLHNGKQLWCAMRQLHNIGNNFRVCDESTLQQQ